MKRHFGGLMAGVLLGAVLSPGSAMANDSSVQLTVGGLTFTKTSAVSIESEDLSIALDQVAVRYVFVNRSQEPVTLTVAFPLPAIDLADGANIAFPTNDPINFVGFSSRVNGEPISFTIDQRAFLDQKDVTSVLRDLNIAVLPIGERALKVEDLPKAARDRAVAEGLLVQFGTNDKGTPLYGPAWTIKTSVVREQTFPPGTPVTVEHRYRTSVGISFDSMLRAGLRRSKAMQAEVQRYKTTYCVGDDFLKSVDKLAGTGESNKAGIVERRISYVLKTGANWAGPIKNFRLVIDAGKNDGIVSFCSDGLKRQSPTANEFRAVDFTPKQDLNILILSKK